MLKIITRLAASALLGSVSLAQGQTLNYAVSEELVESIQLEDLSFTIIADYTSSSLQLRFYDLYPIDSPHTGAVFDHSNFTFKVDDVSHDLALFGQTAGSALDGSCWG